MNRSLLFYTRNISAVENISLNNTKLLNCKKQEVLLLVSDFRCGCELR